MRLKMIAPFKAWKIGEKVTVDNLDQANWLISRKYAVAAPEKKSAAPKTFGSKK